MDNNSTTLVYGPQKMVLKKGTHMAWYKLLGIFGIKL